MNEETFILRTESEALFLSKYGFNTYDIIDCDEGMALNRVDITSWTHELKDNDFNKRDIVFCRCDFEEFKKRHNALYVLLTDNHKVTVQTEKYSKEIESLHNWLNSFEIDKDTQSILDNEVWLRYCNECNNWIEEDEERYIEELGESMCAECALSALKSKYYL